LKLADFMPTTEMLSGFRDIEKRLEARRYGSHWGLIVAIGSAAVQVAVALHVKWGDLAAHPFSREWIPVYVAVPAFSLYIILRYTGFLFKQSGVPFRYTFSISEFGPVASSPGLDQLKLLRYDLMERLDRRIRRFSLLPSGTGDEVKQPSRTSHFHIEGDYATRKENDEEGWILHVWPRVRIGPASNPFNLAFAVQLPLGDKAPSTLEGEDYEHLVERVYSSITTEIYKQIEMDLRNKMTLFPTDSLRALARYTEAVDFETSNTIESYDRALELYRVSLDELKSSWVQSIMLAAGRWAPVLTCWEWTGIRAAMSAEAKSNLGHARCLLYRRLLSAMAGREANPIFVVRQELDTARRLLTSCYNAQSGDKTFGISAGLDQAIDSGADFEQLLAHLVQAEGGRPNRKPLYRAVESDLCELAAVSALAYSMLQDSRKATRLLRYAETLGVFNGTETLGPESDRLRVLILLATAELEPELEAKIRYLRQATEINPQSEIALFWLADCCHLLARDHEKITAADVKRLSRGYEAVLKLNPGNIASLINQGYLYWLVDDLTTARRKLADGIELEKIAGRTFVGDLKYCLARVELERGLASEIEREPAVSRLMKGVFLYEEATRADASVAASGSSQYSEGAAIYYERMTSQMLTRFRQFKDRTLGASDELATSLGRNLPLIQSYALNDYGNASFNYFLRFELGAPGSAALDEAVASYQKAVELNPSNVIFRYNWFLALTWVSKAGDRLNRICEDVLRAGAALPPAFRARVLDVRAQSLYEERSNNEDLKSELNKLQSVLQQGREALEKLSEKERPNEEAKLRQLEQDVAQRQNTLGANMEAYTKKLRDMESLTLTLLETSPRLTPFRHVRDKDGLDKILQLRTINWTAFSDREVSALAAVASAWASLPKRSDASALLCRHILTHFQPDNFDVLRTLSSVGEPAECLDLNGRMEYLILSFRQYDRQSRSFSYLSLQNCDQFAQLDSAVDPAHWKRVESKYEKAREICEPLPDFHDKIAAVYEAVAKELAARENGFAEASKKSEQVLAARKRACALDPEKHEYAENLLIALGRQLIAGKTFEDPLSGRDAPRLIELEFASDSQNDLGFTADGPFPLGLQDRIKEVRDTLSKSAGFTLPGILFRDNRSLNKGKFHFLIRAVPMAYQSLDESVRSRDQQWGALKGAVERTAREQAGRFYSVDECRSAIRKLAKSQGADIENDDLLRLTMVLKMLLAEQAPIAALDAIVCEFRRCRALGLGATMTVEEVRSLPQIRKGLAGNCIEEDFEIAYLSKELEESVTGAVEWTGSEPLLAKPEEFRSKIREFAVRVRVEASTRKRRAILATSPLVRPFAAKACQGLDLPVLSTREILPEVRSRSGDANAAQPTA